MAGIGRNRWAGSARRLCVVVAVLVGALTACSSPVPGTPSAAPGPLRPQDIAIDDVDPCALLTPDQRVELQLDRPPQFRRERSILYPGEESSCSTGGTESPISINISVVTTAGIEFWTSGQAVADLRPVEVAGYPALVAMSPILDDVCKIIVDVAPGQMLDVQARALLADPPIAQDQTCRDAERAAIMAMDTLLDPAAAPEPPPAQPTPSGPSAASDVGAPFDPCRTVTWTDFPEQVRPEDPAKQPTLMEIEPDSGIATGCRFDNSLAEIPLCRGCGTPGQPGTWHFYIAHIGWGDGAWAELRNPPAPDTKQITIGGRPGRLVLDRSPDGGQRCLVKIVLERGAAAVSVLDGRFRTDTCATARSLATVIAERSS